MEDNSIILKINKLSKVFVSNNKRISAIENINLDVYQGEFLVILGPSGCGKTTLLRIIAGLLEPTEGRVMIHVNKGKYQEINEPGKERGMVFQQYTSFPWINVFKNVEFGLKQLESDQAKRYDIVRKHIELVGLKGFERSYPNELSGGMKQRVALARTLATDPEILLLDEPFGALDAETRSVLQRELLNIWSKNRKTVIFVTHDIEEAVFLADRIVILSYLPGTVVSPIEEIKIRRPRTSETKLSEEFLKYKRRISKRLDELGITLAISEWMGHAATYVAKDFGLLGNNIRLKFGSSSTERKEGLEWGEFDCSTLTINALMEAAGKFSQKGDIKIVWSVLKSLGNREKSGGVGTDVLVVRNEMKEVNELLKYRVTYIPGSLEHFLLAYIFLRYFDVDISNYDGFVPPIDDRRNVYLYMLNENLTDAVILCETNVSRALRSGKFKILPVDIDQQVIHCVLLARQKVLKNPRKRQHIKSYIKGLLKGAELMRRDSQDGFKTTASILTKYFADIDNSYFKDKNRNGYFLFDNLDYFTLEENKELYLSGSGKWIYKILEDALTISQRSGIVANREVQVNFENLVDSSIVEELVNEMS